MALMIFPLHNYPPAAQLPDPKTLTSPGSFGNNLYATKPAENPPNPLKNNTGMSGGSENDVPSRGFETRGSENPRVSQTRDSH